MMIPFSDVSLLHVKVRWMESGRLCVSFANGFREEFHDTMAEVHERLCLISELSGSDLDIDYPCEAGPGSAPSENPVRRPLCERLAGRIHWRD
jgi:hypothetical protein